MTEKNSHWQTWTLEHDRKMTSTNINRCTWPKNRMKMTEKYRWKKFIKTTNLIGWIWPKKFNSVIFTPYRSSFSHIFGHVSMFVDVIFSVMYKFFGHIYSVILNRSQEYFSIWLLLLQNLVDWIEPRINVTSFSNIKQQYWRLLLGDF